MSNNVANANTVYRSEDACAERAGLISHFLDQVSDILRRAKGVGLTGYIHCPALPHKVPPSGCRPSWVRREKFTDSWEEGRTCAGRIPDTSRTNVRHLLAWVGNQAVAS